MANAWHSTTATSSTNSTKKIGRSNYYQVLELPNFASIEAVKLAYRELAKRWHPDLHLDNLEKHLFAEEQFKAINIAYVTLKSVESKTVYDAKLQQLLEKIAAYMHKQQGGKIEAPTATATGTSPTKPAASSVTSNKRKGSHQSANIAPQHATTTGKRSKTLPNETSANQPSPPLPPSNAQTVVLNTAEPSSTTNQTEQVVATITPKVSKKQPSLNSSNPSISVTEPVTQVVQAEEGNFAYLRKLRQYLSPTKPVVLYHIQNTAQCLAEGFLTLTPQQAAVGSRIRISLDASHCQKFKLPNTLALTLPPNLKEGQRLRITESTWQGGKNNATANTANSVNSSTEHALILVVQIQQKNSPLPSLGLLNQLWRKIQPFHPENIKIEATDTAFINNQLPVKPTIFYETIQIPLPLAVLGGVYEFTLPANAEQPVAVPIPAGIMPNTVITVELTPTTRAIINVQWQLPNAQQLSPDEKHLYETLLLMNLTEEGRIKQAQALLENEQPPLALEESE